MPPRNFFDMEDAEADAFAEAFAERAPGRLDAFRSEVEATGGPSRAELDGSPASLVPLWRWFVERNEDGGARGREAELPPWYEPDPPELVDERVPPATLRDADGLAQYLAEVFRGAFPGLEWGVTRMPEQVRYEPQNRPQLMANGVEIDVLSVVYVLSLRAVGGHDTDPEGLLRTYRAWVEP